MTSILSAISGQFSRAWIIGAFFPAAAFWLVFLLLIQPLYQWNWDALKPLEVVESTQWRVIAVTFGVIALSALLYTLNNPIIRLFEGYIWQDWPLLRARKTFHEGRFEAATTTDRRIKALRQAFRAKMHEDETLQLAYDTLGQRLNERFPIRKSSVLPTRAGNVLRAFESYPLRVYQMESITIWMRLLSKIDKEYAAGIDSERTAFVFMVNSALLNVAASLLMFGGVFIQPLLAYRLDVFLPWLLELLFFGCSAYLFYLGSVGLGKQWGDMVKSAFDLYRRDVLKQLGYAQTFATLADERALWASLSTTTLYGPPDDPATVTYQNPSTPRVQGKPADVGLSVTRGVTPIAADRFTVTVSVKSSDATRSVQDVVVNETLPEGLLLEWGTLRVVPPSTHLIQVTGSGPYRITLGTLPPLGEVRFEYKAVLVKT